MLYLSVIDLKRDDLPSPLPLFLPSKGKACLGKAELQTLPPGIFSSSPAACCKRPGKSFVQQPPFWQSQRGKRQCCCFRSACHAVCPAALPKESLPLPGKLGSSWTCSLSCKKQAAEEADHKTLKEMFRGTFPECPCIRERTELKEVAAQSEMSQRGFSSAQFEPKPAKRKT